MMMLTLTIKLFLFSWLITRFKPLQMLLEVLPDNLLLNIIRLLLTCLMCFGFWASLIWTGDMFISTIVAFVGFWYDKIIGFYEDRVRLR